MQTRIFIVLMLAVCFAYLLILPVNTCSAEDVQPEHIELIVNKSFSLPVPSALSDSDKLRITIADPAIADFLFIPELNIKSRPEYIYIIGRKTGVTNMTIWKNNNVFRVYDIEVTYDILRLKQKLHEILPDEKDVRVFATKGSVVLSGTVSSAEKHSEALSVASAFIPEENRLVNLLKVSGVHQVMLEVKVAEMSKSTMDKMGINLSWANTAGEFGISLLAGLSAIVSDDAHLLTGPVGQTVSADASGLFRFNSGSNQWTGIIDILKENGLIKILAEPNLIAISGQTASFLAGGEFPVPVPTEDGIGIDYKKYGIELKFTPIVLSEKKIQIKVNPTV
ncbi:MAG: pilus assembly protein N-terminal domain-containing protein, partial [Candidatus Methanoperedenaceae archaeon]|nr:pilus assembly protein N-terminal domain-containing protein [Candidatus Methanoperedenaceae archaeon]